MVTVMTNLFDGAATDEKYDKTAAKGRAGAHRAPTWLELLRASQEGEQ